MTNRSQSSRGSNEAWVGLRRSSWDALEDLQELAVGESIAVRSTMPGSDDVPVVYIAGGTVRSVLDEDPKAALERAKRDAEEKASDHGTPGVRVSILQFKPDVCWSWVHGTFEDKTNQVQGIPPASGRSSGESPEPPLCTVVATEKKEVQLAIPEARGSPSGEIYHCYLARGIIDKVIAARTVDPEQLIPEYCERPD